MRKTIYLFSFLFLFVCAGCGSDEPEMAGEIGCQAYLKNDKGVTEKTHGVFFLFEGTGYVRLDMDSYESVPIQRIKAVKSNGEKVENIGWCTSSKETSRTIVPVYSDSDKDRLDRIQAGTFTIVCLVGYRFDYYEAYMMKTFTKKRTEPIAINATFWTSDFSKTDVSKVPWRD